MPPVSVYMPCYNASVFIKDCIDSVLAQSLKEFEFIIVDDGSTDDTASVIKSYSDSRIRLIESDHNYMKSSNIGINEAKGKYIARMDADDIMMSDRLLIQYNYMEYHPDIDLVAGGMELFGNDIGLYTPIVLDENISMESMLHYNLIAHPTVMMRRDSIMKLPCLYSEEYIYAEDYKLWMTMLDADMELVNLPDILIKHRVAPTQVSRKRIKELNAITSKIQNEYNEKLNYNNSVPE